MDQSRKLNQAVYWDFCFCNLSLDNFIHASFLYVFDAVDITEDE